MPFVTVSAPLTVLMRPKLLSGKTPVKNALRGCAEMHSGRPCRLVSPRSVERNYKDTTNGARTLTAKTLNGWLGESLRTRSWIGLRAGGNAFRLVRVCFTA